MRRAAWRGRVASSLRASTSNSVRWTAADGVSLEVAGGELVTLLGPSGSGKTTLLNMVLGVFAPDSGEIYVDDNPITNVPINKRNIGMVFPELCPVPAHDRAGQHRVSAPYAPGWRGPRSRSAAPTCSTSCASRASASATRDSSAAASSSASPRRGRWLPAPHSCSWTNPLAPSTASCARRCSSSFVGSRSGSPSPRST